MNFMFRYLSSIFFLLSLHANLFSGVNPPEKLVRQYLHKYEALERFNDENDRTGRSDLNQYIIQLDTASWIEESPTRYYLRESYNRLRDALKDFNKSREDSLRFYVVVVNNYYGRVKDEISIDSVPSRAARLRDYVQYNTGADDKYDYKYFSEHSSAVITGIDKELKRFGFVNRIIYFCGVIQLYDVDANRRIYQSDQLLIDGPKLKQKEYAIRYRARTDWKWSKHTQERIETKIEKSVLNIINAVRMVIDMGLDSDQSLAESGCNVTLREAIAQTKKKHDTVFSLVTTAMAKFIDAPSPLQRYKSQYLLVDDMSLFPDKEILLRHILPDKLDLMASGASDFKMYVVFKEVPFAMEPSDWSVFAKQVYEKSNFAKQINNILLLVIPYYRGTCTYTNMLGQEVGRNGMLVFPGAYCPSNSGVTSQINAAFAAGSTLSATATQSPFTMAFNEAFKRIPKDFKVFTWRVLWNGDAIYEGIETYKRITGQEDIVSMRIYQDKRLASYKAAQDNLHCNPEMSLQCSYEYHTALESITDQPADFIVAEGSSDLIQSGMNEHITKQFVENAVLFSLGHKIQVISDNVFYGGKNPFKVKSRSMFLDFIDVASLLASFVGLDVVFDGVGMVYAYSIGEHEEAALYAAAVALPLVTGGTLRAAVIAGKSVIVKGAKGAYHVVSNKMYGLTFRQRSAKDFSHMLQSTLEPTALTKVKAHKDNIEFLDDIEVGMLSDANAAKAINAKPDLVDDFFEFQQRNRGDLKDFMTHRDNIVKLGLDPDVIKSFERIADEPGWFTVVVHGSADGSFLYKVNDTWLKFDHRTLATFMKKNGYTQGTPVRLVACSSGNMNHTLAQDLSNKLGATVKAPDIKVGVDKTGKVVGVEPGVTGQWNTFKPGEFTMKVEAPVAKKTVGESVTALGDIKVAVGASKSQLLTKLDNLPNLKAWSGTLDEVADADLIAKIDGLDPTDLGKLNTDIVHTTYGTEIKTLIKQNPDDLTDIWKRLKDDPAYSWELRKTSPNSRWEAWSQREFFKDVTAKGKGFETDVCLIAFKNRTSAKYLELKDNVLTDLKKNLDEYDMYAQVQLKYSGDNYFVADQLFIKYKTVGGQKVVDDIIVVENKLSSSTPLTPPQASAFKETTFTVRSQSVPSEFGSGTNLTSGSVINFSDSKQWYKVHDGVNGDAITGIRKMQ